MAGGLFGFWSLSSEAWRTLYQTKVVGQPKFKGGMSPSRTPKPDLEGPGAGVLLEPWSFTFKGSSIEKSSTGKGVELLRTPRTQHETRNCYSPSKNPKLRSKRSKTQVINLGSRKLTLSKSLNGQN